MADMLEYYQQISELKKAVRERLAFITILWQINRLNSTLIKDFTTIRIEVCGTKYL